MKDYAQQLLDECERDIKKQKKEALKLLNDFKFDEDLK